MCCTRRSQSYSITILFLDCLHFLCYRYIRHSGKLYLQWKDKRVVTMLSTFHRGSDSVNVQRNTKQNGQHVVLQLRQPKTIHDYNHGMGGVDAFDSRSAAYRIRRKSRKYWKALLYDFIEIACVNNYILFEQYCQDHAEEIQRIRTYDHEEFRVFLIRQLGGLAADAPVPLYHQRGVQDQHREAAAVKNHMPRHTPNLHNCRYCYEYLRVERKCKIFCPGCRVYLHVNERNCYERWHAEKM